MNMRGDPLMPCSPCKARILLKKGKAVIKQYRPFTIQLKYATGETKQDITVGIDLGYQHVGISASTEKRELYAEEVELRQDVTKLLAKRRELRRSRRGRKTRYRAARFNNRVRSNNKGWLAPSIEHKIRTQLSLVEALAQLMPVTDIVVEVAAFDIQKIKNPDISGKDYQQGEQLGFSNVREYVLYRDNHTCRYCKGKSKDPVLCVHHLESRQVGGNAPNNLVTLCVTCHKKLHNGEIALNVRRGRSFKAETFMSITRKTFLDRLKTAFPTVRIHTTYGYITKDNRIKNKIPKSHCNDAFCIAGNFEAKRLGGHFFKKQVRRHNRMIHKANPIKGALRKRNQAPFEVYGFRLNDKVAYLDKAYFISSRRSSGSFELKLIDGTRLKESVNYKKLRLLLWRNCHWRLRSHFLQSRRIV